MSVPEPESAQAAERAVAAAAAAPENADRWSDERVPWHGKPRAADIVCWLGIVVSGLFFWVLLPVRVSLVGTHPVVAELLNGSIESIISAAAFARAGDGNVGGLDRDPARVDDNASHGHGWFLSANWSRSA